MDANSSHYAEMLASGHYTNTLTAADLAISNLTDYAARLGSTKNMVDSQRAFMRSLGEALDQGVGSLVDADANEEFDAPAGHADARAARRSVHVHRQSEQPDRSAAVPDRVSGRERAEGPQLDFGPPAKPW